LGYRRGTQIDTKDRVSPLPQPMPLGRLVVEANLAFGTIYLEKYEQSDKTNNKYNNK
jgi:hypothetical protein